MTVAEATRRAEVCQALAHPARFRILELAAARGPRVPPATPVSPRDLCERINLSLQITSYHVRTLAEAGLIELVNTRTARGAIQHFYRSTDAGDRALKATAKL